MPRSFVEKIEPSRTRGPALASSLLPQQARR